MQTPRLDSLQMKCATAPFFRSDIGDGFGEVPAVAMKILSIILTLAVGVLLRFGQNDRAILSRALTVSFGVIDANLNDVGTIGYHLAFRDGEATLAGFHLNAVVRDAETHAERKSLR